MEHAVTDEVQALECLGLEGLREKWRVRYGAPPTLRSPQLLRLLLAWRIQADAFGGLKRDVRLALGRKGMKQDLGAGLGRDARIAREWQGRRYEVQAIDGGYEYDGRTYRSLSEVAREITGVRWNGPRFFGLRTKP
jgi:hypothetical protein